MASCKWTGQPVCKMYESNNGILFGKRFQPFEMCDDEKCWNTFHSTCQPSTMGYGNKTEFMKDVINDKGSLNFWLK